MTRTNTGRRISVYYFALFAGIGIHLPFWPLWLKDRGLDAGQIGLLVAATYLAKVLFNPLFGHLADHGGHRQRMMVMMAWGTAVLWSLFAFSDNFPTILILTLLANGLWAGLMPLGDGIALQSTQLFGLDYGRVRLWGSIAFIASATLVGRYLSVGTPEMLVWLIVALLVLTALSCMSLPDLPTPSRHETPPPWSHLLTLRPYLIFLAATSLNQVAHTLYYGFATLHWKQAGHSDAVIGMLWSEGVLAEILLFILSGRLIKRIGAPRMLLLASLGGILRWGVLGSTTWLPALATAQILHAATFGCGHLGAMHYLHRHIPVNLSSRAQGFYAAIAVGLAPGLFSPVTGAVFERWGGLTFWLMSALSLGSCLLVWWLCTITPVAECAEASEAQN